MRWAMAALGALIAASAAIEMTTPRWDIDDGSASALARLTEPVPGWPGVVATVEFSRADR